MTSAAGKICRAVIPAAGLGTRLLPETKVLPKEMLPLVDKPAIQHVVEEAVAAGLDQIMMVVGRGKQAIEDHFDGLAGIHYVRQGAPRGVGHAVLAARAFLGDEPFAVVLPDEVIESSARVLGQLIAIHRRTGGSAVALARVPRAEIGRYGCAAVEPTADPGVVRITGLVEKPEPGRAPSDLAVVGRFVLGRYALAELDRTRPGRGGEIQLTDALHALAQPNHPGGPVHGFLFSGERHDTGDRSGYLRALVTLACGREDIGAEFRSWLRDFVAAGSHDDKWGEDGSWKSRQLGAY